MAISKITTSGVATDTLTAADLAPNSVDSSELVDGSIDTAHLGNLQVTAAKVASDVATTAGTQTFTNKTLTAPTLTTPALGTPASGVVTNLSGVLPVGVTGGSGLTALGTVTSANLSNTAIAYPAGHIVQVVSSGWQSEGVAGTASANTSVHDLLYPNGSTKYEKQITITSGNKVFVSCNFNLDCYANLVSGTYNASIGGGYGMKVTTSSGTDATLITPNASDVMFQITGQNSYYALYRKGVVLSYLHTPDITNPNYYLTGISIASRSNVRVGIGGANWTLMEIQV